MKSALLGILVLLVGTIAMASSCAVNHKSGEYACTTTADCNSGRQCVNNFCIIPGSIDAAIGPGDGNNQCPSQCSSCNSGTHTCVIDCALNPATCNNQVRCPPGWACNVNCDTDNSCTSGVVCGTATSCTVQCSAKGACQNVACGASKCTVNCTGAQSCKNVACGNSCACDVSCLGAQSCADTIQCTSAACKLGLGCSSAITSTCHSC